MAATTLERESILYKPQNKFHQVIVPLITMCTSTHEGQAPTPKRQLPSHASYVMFAGKKLLLAPYFLFSSTKSELGQLPKYFIMAWWNWTSLSWGSSLFTISTKEPNYLVPPMLS